MQAKQTLDLIVQYLDECKAIDIVQLDIHKHTDIADYMVICSGTSSRHVMSISKRLVTYAKEHGHRPLGVEEDSAGSWILVDFGDVIVNIMQPETREFYRLEQLWDLGHESANSSDQ